MNSRNWFRTAASLAAGSLVSMAKPLSTTLLIAAGSASVAAAASIRNSSASAICFLYGAINGTSAASGRNVRADGVLSIGTEAGVTTNRRDVLMGDGDHVSQILRLRRSPGGRRLTMRRLANALGRQKLSNLVRRCGATAVELRHRRRSLFRAPLEE